MWKPSPLFNLLGVMACVAAGFFLLLKIGFLLHHDPIPAPLESTTLTVAAALVLLTGLAATVRLTVTSVAEATTRAKAQRSAQASHRQYVEERRRRVAELAADPARARYAPLVERGEDWSDENIAYQENRSVVTTCCHLQPVEVAMRQATGIKLRRSGTVSVTATCRIDFNALQRTFAIAAPLRYAEFFTSDRGDDEYPVAFLICDEHSSMIHTIHPAESKTAPWFPASQANDA